MLIPDGLKLNKYKPVRVPSPAEVMQVHGFRTADDSLYSGDDNAGDAPMNKTEALDKAYNDLSRMCDEMAEKEKQNHE